jgi:glycosyltransferase involved in cell wall biosynthesis
MRKIVFIAANEKVKWGGSEFLWSGAAKWLKRENNEVWISFKDWSTPVKQLETLRSVGCRVFYRPSPSLVGRLKSHVSPVRYFRKHIRMIGRNADLIVVSQGGNTDGLDWMEAALAEGMKYVCIAQCASELWWPDDNAAERLAVAYENAAGTYFVSQANLDLCRNQFASPLKNGKVIRNPFNVRYDASPSWPSSSSDEISLACIARLDASVKGIDVLLGVLSLAHWRNRKVRVSLAGEGPNERVLRCMIENLKLSNVTILGQQSDVEEIWRNHHALVLPTRVEGMPLVVVEAMLCGRPCIVTDVGGSRELIRDGVNGFLAKAPTVELFDEAMNRAWGSRIDLRVMGDDAAADARRWVSEDPCRDFARDIMT